MTERTVDIDAPPNGLSAAEAERRLAQSGPNVLAAARRRSALAGFAAQFRNVLMVMLIGAAILAAIVGDMKDAVVIAVIVVINALLGFVQEQRAERSVEALRRMLVAQARVRRDGVPALVDAADVVPGDVLLVEAGDRIAADGSWARAHELAIDESTLTGESEPVVKQAGDDGFMNTVVTAGRGELAVNATGMATRIGGVAELLRSAGPAPKTPLQRQLGTLTGRLVTVAAFAVAAVFIAGMARGGRFSDEVLNAVALATAAIPEGLPAVVTVTLALGARHLARRGAIVKRLASVETLGATTVICTDKTGTLTRNEMSAQAVVVDGQELVVTGNGYGGDGAVVTGDAVVPNLGRLCVALALCNDSHVVAGEVVGDPMEGALLVLARKAGLDVDNERASRARLGELPFDSARKYMATFHRRDDGLVDLYVKGAPDVLVALTTLDDKQRDDVAAHAAALARRGLRVLGAAVRTIPMDEVDVAAPAPHVDALEFLGLVGIMDTPRPEARGAIADCNRAGIAVKMITGDHADTARSIAGQVGIDGDVVTGIELDAMSDDELDRRIDGVGVCARVAPEHKVRIVDALQRRHEVVAMTGDGVNDAPALKRADIGIAMGRAGTEVSKEAATLVLTDDNFTTIVAAARRGRTIYDNIVKFVRYQLTTNVGAILVVVTAAILGVARPFSAIHVLWVNLITDGPPGIALGVDPPGPDTMRQPPRRPGAAILTGRRLTVVGFHAVVMAAGTLALYAWAGTGTSRGATLAFTTFVLFQVANALNVRAEGSSAFTRHSLTNSRLWAALAAVVALQVLVVQLPALHNIFHTTGLAATDWALASAVALTVIAAEEVRLRVTRTAQ